MLQDISDPEWILHRARASALRAFADQRLVFDALIRPRHLPAIIETARRHPDLTIILDHAAKPFVDGYPDPAWVSDIARAAQQPNIACKISGLVTEAVAGARDSVFEPYFRVLLDAFGVDRLVFGSDWPVLTQVAPYGRWTGIVKAWLKSLGPAASAAVMGENAQRFYLSRGRP
jgi:L-fuconolactonase